MISLLCPSRQRSELLKQSMESLAKGNYELLVAIDADDPELEAYRKIKGIRLFVTPPYGYGRLYKYYNLLSLQARGEWLMLWNDDAIMETENWADIIHSQDASKPVVLTTFHEVNNLFPVISRKFYDIIGHFGENTHVDSWVQQIGEQTGTQFYVPLKIIHNKPTDETGQASTHTAIHTGAMFNSEEVKQQIREDAAKIGRWYENN